MSTWNPLDEPLLEILLGFVAFLEGHRITRNQRNTDGPDEQKEYQIIQVCIKDVTERVAKALEDLSEAHEHYLKRDSYKAAQKFISENLEKLEKENEVTLRRKLALMLSIHFPPEIKVSIEDIKTGMKNSWGNEVNGKYPNAARGSKNIALYIIAAIENKSEKTIRNRIWTKSRKKGPHQAATNSMINGCTSAYVELFKRTLGLKHNDLINLAEMSTPEPDIDELEEEYKANHPENK